MARLKVTDMVATQCILLLHASTHERSRGSGHCLFPAEKKGNISMGVVFLRQASARQAGVHGEASLGRIRCRPPSKPKRGRSVMSPQWRSPS